MLTELFIHTTAAFCFAYYFVNVAGIPMMIKRALKREGRIKPLDCVTCLTVWTSVALLLLPVEVSVYTCFIFLAGFIATKIK